MSRGTCPDEDGCTSFGCQDYCEGPDIPCRFCGDLDCDGSGYNCADDHYQTYNEQGPGISGTRQASDAERGAFDGAPGHA
jgi:hypothetical protein